MDPKRPDILWPGTYGGPNQGNMPLRKVGIADVTAALIAAPATTEVIVFDTTMIREPDSGLMDYAAWLAKTSPAATREQPLPFLGLFLTVFADQDLQLFHRTLGAGATTWRDLLNFAGTPASPTAYTHTANPARYFVRLSGADEQLVLKTTGTPPTVAELSVRLTSEYFVPTT
jgi:hypothetical protein